MSKVGRTMDYVEELLERSPGGLDWEDTRSRVALRNGETIRQANRTLANAMDALDLAGTACVDPSSNRIVVGTVYPSPSARGLAAKIARDFAGRSVTRRQIVHHYQVSYPSAARALAWMGTQEMASSQRVGSVAGWLVHER